MLAGLLTGVGVLIAFVFSIWIIVLAFKESVGWGICSLLIPFVSLVFAFTHWGVCKKPFLGMLGGMVIAGVGVALGAGDAIKALPEN